MKYIITSTSSWGDIDDEDFKKYLPILKKYDFNEKGVEYTQILVNQLSRQITKPTINIEDMIELNLLAGEVGDIIIQNYDKENTGLYTIEIYDGYRE